MAFACLTTNGVDFDSTSLVRLAIIVRIWIMCEQNFRLFSRVTTVLYN